MSKLIDEAFEFVQKNDPSPTTYLVARLGCELERAYSRNTVLDKENRYIRDSYGRLKKWFSRQFKYYKAHRDELLNDKNETKDGMDGTVLHRPIETR